MPVWLSSRCVRNVHVLWSKGGYRRGIRFLRGSTKSLDNGSQEKSTLNLKDPYGPPKSAAGKDQTSRPSPYGL